MLNRSEKKEIFDKIISLEKSINNSINQAFSEMDKCNSQELIDVAKRFALGEKIVEYHDNIHKLQSDYITKIINNLNIYKIRNEVSEEILTTCLGYIISSRKNQQ
jgi:hypothetical protein